MKGRWFVVGLLSLIFLSASVDDSASRTIAVLMLNDAARYSELIVTGELEDVNRYVLDDSDRRYNSVSYIAVVKVKDTIKGKIANDRILVECKTTEEKWRFFFFPVSPLFRKGERVMLFLNSVKSNVYDGNTYQLSPSWRLRIKDNRIISPGVYFSEEGKGKSIKNLTVEEIIEAIRKVK